MKKDLMNDYTDEFKRYLVVVVGKQMGRYFTIYRGELENDGSELKDNVHEKDILESELHLHLKHIATESYSFYKRSKHSIDGVFIGGHQELLKSIQEAFPNELGQKVMGTFVTDVDLSLHDLVAEVKEKFKL